MSVEGTPHILHDVPFCQNWSDRCLPANIHSMLKYFMPEQPFNRRQVAELCGYVAGIGTWQTQSLLSLADLGLEVAWVTDDDLPGFVDDPRARMEQLFPDPKRLKKQLSLSDLDLEAGRIMQYLERDLPYEQRPGTINDITNFLGAGWLVRLSVNGTALFPTADQTVYGPHSVLAVGYGEVKGEEGVFLHNADSIFGNVPNQFVPWERLAIAREQFGNSQGLNAYRGP